MRDIIRKVEDKVFLGTINCYNIFKDFDIDKDGFVSQKDLEIKIKELNVLNQEELPLFINYVDTD